MRTFTQCLVLSKIPFGQNLPAPLGMEKFTKGVLQSISQLDIE